MWGSRDVTHVRLTWRHSYEVKSLMLGSRDVTHVRLTWHHSCEVKPLMLVSRDVTHVRLTLRHSYEVFYDYYNIFGIQWNILSGRPTFLSYDVFRLHTECLLDLLSWGYPNVQTYGHIIVNGELVRNTSSCSTYQCYAPGVKMAGLALETCTMTRIQSFNTYYSSYDTTALIKYISNVANGSIIVGVTNSHNILHLPFHSSLLLESIHHT